MRYPTDPTYKQWLHSSDWRKLREDKLTAQPWCEDCLLAHRRTPATEVHHKQPVLSFPSRQQRRFMMFNINNLASLCSPCHLKRHDRHDQQANQAERAQNRQQAFRDKYGK